MATPNLKFNIGADTKDFTKGMKTVKADLKEFEGLGNSALSKLGSAFGVNTSKLNQFGSAVRGLGAKLAESGNTGAAAFGKVLSSVNAVGLGIAGLGLGAAVTAFKALKEEADNFKTTLAGANIEMATAAYIDTYKQVLHDMNSDTGKAVAEAQSSWKKFWKTLGPNIKQAFASGAIFAGADPMGNSAAWDNYFKATSEAADKAAEAERISNEIYKTERAISDAAVVVSENEAKIAEYKRIAADSTESTAARMNAINEAQKLINENYEKQGKLEQEKASLMKEMNDLAESTPAQIDAANQQQIKANSLLRAREEGLRSLVKLRQRVTKEAEKEAEAEAKAQASRAMREGFEAKNALMPDTSALEALLPKTLETVEGNLKPIKVKVELDEESIEITAKELQSLATSAIGDMAVAIGELVGDLATGGDAWNNFANTALTALADMAIKVGELAIATGVASLGIEAALKLGGPYAAIAAGAALVALGAAVKAGLSNAMSGSTSGTASASAIASGRYSSATQAGSYEQQTNIEIEVTGTLRGEGSALVAVLNNEAKRKNHTT